LLDIIDPATGQHPIQTVYRRDELYHGPFVDQAPDLIIEPRRDDVNPAYNTLIQSGLGPDFMRSSAGFTGNHALDGIVAATGTGIPVRKITNARLIDLASTILHALDLPIPRDMEGRVLPLWSEPQDVQWLDSDDPPSTGPKTDQPLDAAEAAAVKQRLRSLGYL
jgi:predicted AlkP superfamily phosphohydrolase/phosphomutase